MKTKFKKESYPRDFRYFTGRSTFLFIYIAYMTYVRFYTYIFILYRTKNENISTFEVLPVRTERQDESNKIVLTHLHQ